MRGPLLFGNPMLKMVNTKLLTTDLSYSEIFIRNPKVQFDFDSLLCERLETTAQTDTLAASRLFILRTNQIRVS